MIAPDRGWGTEDLGGGAAPRVALRLGDGAERPHPSADAEGRRRGHFPHRPLDRVPAAGSRNRALARAEARAGGELRKWLGVREVAYSMTPTELAVTDTDLARVSPSPQPSPAILGSSPGRRAEICLRRDMAFGRTPGFRICYAGEGGAKGRSRMLRSSERAMCALAPRCSRSPSGVRHGPNLCRCGRRPRRRPRPRRATDQACTETATARQERRRRGIAASLAARRARRRTIAIPMRRTSKIEPERGDARQVADRSRGLRSGVRHASICREPQDRPTSSRPQGAGEEDGLPSGPEPAGSGDRDQATCDRSFARRWRCRRLTPDEEFGAADVRPAAVSPDRAAAARRRR